MLSLRGTQSDFVDKAVGVLASSSTKKCVMVAPVAYGKSICIANIIYRLDSPVIIIQPNKELLAQNFKKYTDYGYPASICCQSMKLYQRNNRAYTEIDGKEYLCDEVTEVTFATIGSIKSMINDVKKLNVKYLIVDECHINTKVDSSIRGFIRNTKIKNILGVTATPIILTSSLSGAMLRMIDSSKHNLFSTISHVVQIEEMVKNGYWSKLIYDIKHFNSRGLKFNSSGAAYTPESLKVNYELNGLEDKCIEVVSELRKEGRKSILVFVPDVESAISLRNKIERSYVIHGKTDKDERLDIVNKFKSLKIDVVINVEILTTGFDHPELDAIVMARPTASIALYYQIMGRITRIHKNKPNGRVIDLSGNVTKFGKIENLNYDFIEGYGWGLFTKDTLLTGFPIAAVDKPTKKSIVKYASKNGIKLRKINGEFIMPFGKFKGKPLNLLDIYYFSFIYYDWNFIGKDMEELKKSIEIILKLK